MSNQVRQNRAIPSTWLMLILLVILSYTSMYNNVSLPNERSRIYLATAMVDDDSFSIDRSLRRFGRIGDRATYNGHYYSDKAPGTSFLGALSYRIVRLVTDEADWSIQDLLRLMRSTIAIPLGLLGFVWIRRLLFEMKVSNVSVEWVSWGWILGSAAFHYAGAFFGHQIAATFLVGALLYMQRSVVGNEKVAGPALVSGALCGCAVLTEYPAAVGLMAIAIYGTFARNGRLKRMLCWLGAGIPFALLLGYYHYTCFDDPLSFPYQHLAAKTYRKIHNAGFAGVTGPEFEGFKLWFLSLRRGLLSTSPYFLLSIIGCMHFPKSDRGLTYAFSFLLVVCILFASGAHIWGGDWGFGPRLLVFSLGLLCVPTAIALDACQRHSPWRFIALSAILFGIYLNQLVHVCFPEPWAKSNNPLSDIVLPMLDAHLLAPNLASIHLGLEGIWSGVPILVLLTIVQVCLIQHAFAEHRLKNGLFMSGFVIIALGGLLALPAASEQHQVEWIDMVKTWAERESRYH